jgi:O-antigen/teichoic acid export membrane protein
MHYLAYADMLHKALLGILGIGLVVLGYKATAQVWLLVVLAFGLLAISWWWYRGYMSIDWKLHVGRAKAFLRGSLSFWAFSLFFTFYLWVDSAMLLNLTPHQVVGWYGVATKLFGALMAIPIILATAWLPRMVVAFEERPESLRAVARTPIEDGLILSLAVAVGAALTAAPIIRLLYGSAFMPAAPVLVILAFTVIPMFFNSMVFQVLVARRKQVVWTAAMIFATIVNPLLNLWLIPHFQRTQSNGAVGAAYALLVTEIVIAAAGLILVRGIVTLGTLARLGRAAAAVALMGAAVWVSGRFGLISQVLIGLIVFGGAAIAFRVPTPDERRELGMMVDRSRRWVRGRLW